MSATCLLNLHDGDHLWKKGDEYKGKHLDELVKKGLVKVKSEAKAEKESEPSESKASKKAKPKKKKTSP